jgi:CRISPR-associated exonuclease Cas4
MLSALQHVLFCKRQCALIHMAGIWDENRLTAAGRVLHERVDEQKSESRRSLLQATAVRLVSHRLGVSGIADMVEFHSADSEFDDTGMRTATTLPGHTGFWRPFPVEYKRGRPKSHRADEVQLCAQAICLEEMINVVVPTGALFYGEPRRRTDVVFDEELRQTTAKAAEEVHRLISSGKTPPPTYGKWCTACSLVNDCCPKQLCRSARQWLEQELNEVGS